MEKIEFIDEYVNSIVDGYETNDLKEIKECIASCLKMSMDISEYNGYENLQNFRSLTQEDYLKIS